MFILVFGKIKHNLLDKEGVKIRKLCIVFVRLTEKCDSRYQILFKVSNQGHY